MHELAATEREAFPQTLIDDAQSQRRRPRGHEVGDRIRASRLAAGLSQRCLATRLGVHRCEVERWELTGRGLTWNHLDALAEELDVSSDWLYCGPQLAEGPAAPDWAIEAEAVAAPPPRADRFWLRVQSPATGRSRPRARGAGRPAGRRRIARTGAASGDSPDDSDPHRPRRSARAAANTPQAVGA